MVAVNGHPSAFREVRLAGLRPVQEPAPTDTVGHSSVRPATDVGVHLIHHIPGGTACVDDQVEWIMKQNQSFTDLLYSRYKDLDVAQKLAEQNNLVPDSQGAVTVYVPPGEPVVIPAMCYSKTGTDAVTLEASGDPAPPSPGHNLLVASVILVILYVILMAAGNVRRRWKS
jgi:hypothetical protein